MSTIGNVPVEQDDEKHASSRARRRRQYVLARVREADGPVTERELATGFVRTQSTDRRRSTTKVRVSLRHRDLPKLDASGLVSWNRAEQTVTASTNAGATEDVPGATSVLPDEPPADRGRGTDDARSRVRAVLETEDEPVDASALARRVAGGGDDPSSDAVESVLVRLHHVHLPKLEDEGLLEYDAADRTVVPRRA